MMRASSGSPFCACASAQTPDERMRECGDPGYPDIQLVGVVTDAATGEPLDEAVVALDRFLVPGLVLLSEVRAAADGLTGRDCRQVRRVAQLAATQFPAAQLALSARLPSPPRSAPQ